METRFTILLIELGVALAIQIGLLAAVYLAVQRSTKQMESLAGDIRKRALPALDTTQELLNNIKPKIEEILNNAADSSTALKAQIDRLDGTVTDIVDRTRLHVIRADNLLGRTIDRVEETTELVQNTVISPIRQISALVQGLTAGINALFGRHAKPGSTQRDEMFI